MEKIKFPVIILINPQMPENIGMSARAMMNCGFSELRIVNPRERWPNNIALKSAAHGSFILDKAKIFNNFETSTKDLKFLIGTSVRKRFANKNHFFDFKSLFKSFPISSKVGIVFGPERSGLTNEQISKCDCIFSLPIYKKKSSLNLSHSILLVAYEFSKLNIKKNNQKNKKINNTASKKEFYQMIDHLYEELEYSGFFHPLEKAKSMFLNIQNMFIRANFTSQEIRTFRGIIRNLSKSRNSNKDY